MKDDLLQNITDFFIHHYKGGTVLLAYSGGPDSTALFHLIQIGGIIPLKNLHVCHVDHGWREESSKEAEELKKEVDRTDAHFYLKKLSKEIFEGRRSWEDLARQERKKAFHDLYRSLGCSCLILGHQADDQAETVLKRILEGASLAHFRSMDMVEDQDGMAVWRPLLRTPKEKILIWLQSRGISFHEDKTNVDPRFLRSRIRNTILPSLEEHFGKSIRSNLIHCADQARLLHSHLERCTQDLGEQAIEGPFGLMWEASLLQKKDPLELDFFLRQLFRKEGEPAPSRTLLQNILDACQQGSANARFPLKKNAMAIADRGYFFWLRKPIPMWDCEMSFKTGTYPVDNGKWVLERSPFAASSNWHSMWKGALSFEAPEGCTLLKPYLPSLMYSRSKDMDEWMCAHKVPAFLRRALPLLADESGILGELLTGALSTTDKKGMFYTLHFENNKN